MDKKTLILIIIAVGLVVVVGKILLFPNSQKTLLTPLSSLPVKQIKISNTSKTYADDSGFSFNYPDNLSLAKNKSSDPLTYADISLSDKDVEGSLDLKIVDTNLTSLDQWVKSNKVASDSAKLVKLGQLSARLVKVENYTLLAALDQGILFTLKYPQKDFWQQISQKVAADFSFSPPQQADSPDGSTSSDVEFESEEVVE